MAVSGVAVEGGRKGGCSVGVMYTAHMQVILSCSYAGMLQAMELSILLISRYVSCSCEGCSVAVTYNAHVQVRMLLMRR